jgi:hypothetical protein
MTRIRRWNCLTLLCFALSPALVFRAELLAAGLAEPAGKEAATNAPDSAIRASRSEPQRQVVKMELTGQKEAGAKLGYGNCQWLGPLDAPPKKLLQEPKYRSKHPVYYAARYGDAKENVFTLAIDESAGPGKGYDVVYVDSNNDGRIDPEKERFKFDMSTTSHDVPLRIHFMVTAGGVTAPYYVSFTAFPYSDSRNLVEKIHANLRNSSYYQGEAILLGKRRRIAIADLNSNGLFNDVEKGLFQGERFFVDLDGEGESRNRHEQMASFPYGGLTRIGRTWYSIVASPDGSQITITRPTPALGKVEASPGICAAGLLSPTQSLDLKFTNGPDSAVAGAYRVQSVQLLAKDEGPDGRTLQGSFGGWQPELTIREGETARITAGLPLKVEPQVVVDEGRTLRIGLLITGSAGETYRWSPRSGSSSKAGFKIVDRSGKQIASGEFDYG